MGFGGFRRAEGSARLMVVLAFLGVLGGGAWAALGAFAASGPPQPTISAKPTDPSNNPSPSFTYTDGGAVARFECQLDNGGFSACGTTRPSSKSYTGLTPGSHTFQVRAVTTTGANAGTSSAASYAWMVDTTQPTVSLMVAADPTPTGAGSVRWTVTFSEPVTGVAKSNFTTSTAGISGGNTNVSNVSGGGSVYTVTASTGTQTPSGSGTEQLVLSSGGGIKDLAGYGLSGAPVGGATYTVDHLAPRVASMTRL